MKTINSFRSKLAVFMIALVASISTFAYDFQDGYLFYNILEDGTAAVTSEKYGFPYDYLPTALIIPDRVTDYNGKTYIVTEIANYAFGGCDMLESLVIPNTVKKIGMYAFTACTKLVDISFPDSLEDIMGGALYECAWYNNQPDGLIYIGNLLYRYKGTAPAGTIIVKEGTTAILDFTFHNQPNIQSVILPESLTSIHLQAFYGCTNITELILPASIQIIENQAFAYCTSLTEVTCYATIPPVRGDVVSDSPSDWFFEGVDVSKIPLYVPVESIDLYKEAEQWSGFHPILSIQSSYKSQWCNQWNILEYNVSGMGIPEETWRYYLAEDITINGTTYTTVNRYWTADKTKCGSVATIRFTENQKVYALLGDTEYLVYDFSVQVGDTIETIVGVNYGTMLQQLLVHQIDIAMPTGPKTITLYPICKMEDGECDDCDEDGHYLWECCPIEWIEGIGSTDGFLMGYPPCGHVGGIGHKLLCAYKDDELQYINELYQDDYGCEYNAGPFNEKLLGTWRVVGGNEIISISDSIIVFKYLGLTQKYTASATQLTVERLWIPEEESYRWANCNYTLSNDTLWIDNFMPLLVATYPPTFGPITLVKVKHEDLFPTLWGLQRTVCNEYCGDTEDDNSANFTYKQTFDSIFFENDKPYILCNGYLLREEDNKIFLYSQSLNKDIVLYDFTLEVGDSLPAYIKDFDGTMYSDDTLVVTDISSVTLLDGKEYKKWTFDNGMEYVEGIGMYGGHRNGNFFGLIQEIVVPCHIGTHLVCVSKNNKLLYQMDDAEMERLGAECLCEIEQKWSETWCNQWNILSHGYLGPQDPLAGARTSIYWLSNNTVNRNGHEYIPLMCSSSLPNEESTLLVGELRFTEDKQVYFYYAFDETEYLLYDFGAELGDTLELFAGLEFYNYHKTYTHVITDKETLDDGRLQIQADVVIRIDNGAGEYFEEKHPVTWIEGLGSTYGIIFNPSNPGVAGDGAIIMLCAYRDDECVYTTNFSDYKNMGCVYNNDGTVDEDLFPMLAGLQRTVCNEYCEDSKTSLQKFEEIRFEHDQPYIYCYSAFLIREENNKILIYSHSLDKDLVLYDFTLEVGDSLPRLYLDESAKKDLYWIYYDIMNVVDYHKDDAGNILPADTLIVTDVSAITLLDGKEYKKWTFNNGMEYVEGIGSFGNNNWSGDFFRLIGNMGIPACLHGEHLICVSKNNKLLYQMDDAEMERLGAECLCDYNSGPKKDNAKNGKIGGRPTPTQWNMLEVETKELDGTPTIMRAETFSYTLENDSIVTNGKTFYQLARQSTKDTAITKSFVGALHFGEDEDNRVYFLRDGIEYVLYDFTAEPGDTIEIFAGINNYPQETTYTHVVVDKDTTEDGACRMFLEVVFPDETTTATNVEKVWLAGLGSIDGIVHNAAQRTSDAHAAPAKSASSETQTSVMLCAWREDSCLYTTNHPEYDTFGCVYNQDPTAIENLTSPTSYQKIIHEGTLLILHEGKVYNVIGIQIK